MELTALNNDTVKFCAKLKNKKFRAFTNNDKIMSVTLKTIAEYTGLSVTTVSRALKDGDDVKIEITTIDYSGKIQLTKDNTSLNDKKYILGSGCYLDLDN